MNCRKKSGALMMKVALIYYSDRSWRKIWGHLFIKKMFQAFECLLHLNFGPVSTLEMYANFSVRGNVYSFWIHRIQLDCNDTHSHNIIDFSEQ